MAAHEELGQIAAIADIEEAEIDNDHIIRRFHPRDNPFETLTERQFIREFRLNKEMARDLIAMLEPYLDVPSRKSALDTQTKVSLIYNSLERYF